MLLTSKTRNHGSVVELELCTRENSVHQNLLSDREWVCAKNGGGFMTFLLIDTELFVLVQRDLRSRAALSCNDAGQEVCLDSDQIKIILHKRRSAK